MDAGFPHKPKASHSGFNVSIALHDIIREICDRVSSFGHIVPEGLHVCISSNRSNGRGATFGKLVPLRFRGGEELLYHRGKCYAMPRIVRDGNILFYIIYFYSPRFLDLPPVEKLRVIFHELYHISPDFNGDIRRFGKGGSAHGSSKKRFDLRFEAELREFLEYMIETEHWEFMNLDARGIFEKYKKIISYRMKTPRPTIID